MGMRHVGPLFERALDSEIPTYTKWSLRLVRFQETLRCEDNKWEVIYGKVWVLCSIEWVLFHWEQNVWRLSWLIIVIGKMRPLRLKNHSLFSILLKYLYNQLIQAFRFLASQFIRLSGERTVLAMWLAHLRNKNLSDNQQCAQPYFIR